MKEHLSLVEVEFEDWIQKLKDGFPGIHTGNRTIIYTFDKTNLQFLRNGAVDSRTINDLQKSLVDGYRSFYYIDYFRD